MSRPDRAHPPSQLLSARGKFIPEKTAALLRQQIPFQPKLAIVLGSGFQSLAGESLIISISWEQTLCAVKAPISPVLSI
jgi:hypothetical protein